MAEMGLAVGAADLGTRHEVRTVHMLGDGAGLQRLVETRPARAGIIFRLGAEKRLAAGDAFVDAVLLVVEVRAGERVLGAVLAGNPVFLRRKLLAPFSILLITFSILSSGMPASIARLVRYSDARGRKK